MKAGTTVRNIRRDLTKRQEFEPPRIGHTTVPDGYEIADIEITADLEAIARRLGIKAMRNKSGKATALHGLVKVYVSNSKRFPQS